MGKKDDRYYMSSVKLGPKGQIVIPKEARAMFGLEPGDTLVLLADTKKGIALQTADKRYPAFSLESVSFSVPEGAVMGFIGRNGAGKSTTLKSILGLVHPDAGEVTVLGKSFRKDEQYIKERIGVVLGGIDFYPRKKVRLLSDVTRRFYGNWQEEKYRHYLDLFGIDQEKRVDQLSTGMRVKYMIALALSHDARLLILDEPTSGLDPVSRDELTELLRRIAADGHRSVLFSTHITSDLEKCASHITFIKDGTIQHTGTLADFRQHYDYLRQPGQELTLEDIIVSVERRPLDENAIV